MRSVVFIVLALLVTISVAGCTESLGEERPIPKRHIVAMEGMVFQPATLTVAAGDSVVWVNKDLVPHAVVTSGEAFDSKVIEFSKSSSHTFAARGDFEYVCPFHPTMKGMVHVQ